MTDKEFEKFLKDHSKSNFPTSGWVSKTDGKGNKEWNHYRFHDTSGETTSIFWTFVLGFGIFFIIQLFGCSL